jgi:tetratricopeptide (TPR) repeat protein
MRINLQSATLGAVLVGCGLTGCASTDERSLFKGLDLPSPAATVKASEPESEPARSGGWWGRKKAEPSEAENAESQFAMDMLRARGHEQAGELDKARKVYEGLRNKRPDDMEVVHRLGVVADLQKRHGEAEGLFLHALQRQTRNAELLADLGYCYFLQGQLTKAESALTKATMLEPANPRYRNNLGLVIGHLGRHQEALAHFRKSGTEADAQYNLAFVYAAQDRNEQAKLCFHMALAADPGHARSREALDSFKEYERLPEHLRNDEFVAQDGVRYVPYIEGSQSQDGAVVQASATAPLPTGRNISQTNRSLLLQSRGLDRASASAQ